MTEDEIQLVRDSRPEAPPYRSQARAAARRRVVDVARANGWAAGTRPHRAMWHRPRTMVLAGALAVAVGAVAVGAVVVADRSPGGGVLVGGPTGTAVDHGGYRGSAVVELPRLAHVSAEEVLDRAARRAAAGELDPRDDQFVVVESQTMYRASRFDEKDGKESESRHLYRTKRSIWQSADGTRPGALKIEHLEPLAYPGWPLTEEARREAGTTEWFPLPACRNVDQDSRTDYAALKRLPADPKEMRAYLYGRDHGDNGPDKGAWTAVGDILRENLLPAAQRAALFKAAGTIPGVTAIEEAEDAAGRKGIAVGRESNGIREDLIFDRETYEFLGEREIAVNAEAAEAPVGSLLASTAQLKTSVADAAPEVEADDSRAMIRRDCTT